MNEEEFSLVLDKLKGKTKFIYYHLMGEPLTHPKLPEFIKLAGEKGYKSIITTNGTLLEKRGEELLSAGIHKINVSLHSFENGDQEGHEKYIRKISDFSKKAEEKGTIVNFRLWNKGFDDGKNETTLALLKENIPGEWTENGHGFNINKKTFLEWGDRFEWPDSEAELKTGNFRCYGLKDQFGILSDGTVVPCCLDSEGTINLGNIFSEDIDSILGSKRATDIVEGFKCGKASEELCKRCGYAQRFV